MAGGEPPLELLHEPLMLRRLSSDAPEASLADKYERLAVDGTLCKTVGQHG